MKAWKNNPELKKKYVNLMRKHQKADRLTKGIYWEYGKGCAVGCMWRGKHHDKFETELEIPAWLAYLEDTIFEGLPDAKSQEWPVRFLSAIPVGVDLEPIKSKFLYWLPARVAAWGAARAPAPDDARAAAWAAWAAAADSARAAAYERIAEKLIELLRNANDNGI